MKKLTVSMHTNTGQLIGRNGIYDIQQFQAEIINGSKDESRVWITGISTKTAKELNGGFTNILPEEMDKFCNMWLRNRGYTVIANPDWPDEFSPPCPYCGNRDAEKISYDRPMIAGDDAYQKCHCEACNSIWNEVYPWLY